MKKNKGKEKDKEKLSEENTGHARVQYGVVPYRVGEHGRLEVMLVTSRERRRWVVPKGWPIKNLKPYSSAEREAYEEAGLVGRIGKRSVGSYQYGKRLTPALTVTCEVELFPLKVRKQLKRFPEKDQREGRWFGLEEAASLVEERELGEIVRRLDQLIEPASSAA